MVEKILDNYYMKKLKDNIEFDLLCYCLDFEFIIEKDKLSIMVKKKLYKDYTSIIKLDKKYCFSYICDYNELIAGIKRLIEEYIEGSYE